MARNKIRYLISALGLLTLLYAFQNCSPIGKSALVAVSASSQSPGPTLYSPNVSAGTDQTVTGATATISATASDYDGLISNVQWIQISGPSSATLSGASTLNLTASGLVTGNYVFRISVTDNDNLSKTDDVMVSVAPVASGVMPTFASINTNILVPKCASCHGAVGGAGGYSVANYASVTVASQVTKGNATTSNLYVEVNSGSMPVNLPMLTAAEILAIRDWINAGALNN